ncbi:hypothetical protein BS47DRAFT_1401812 [Hydnum rufescens UP504]|uniref:malate dehydrogenase n=1 Tax=Hydnum rufescens UP504 TaxID=1448309 RepID=A0A9P6ADV8_9AGAM|nr:hypothetical protein BS47DRAFT_1401812 [Hydnum rufescens UP504]
MNAPNNNPRNENMPNNDWLSTTHSLSLYDISGALGIAADMSHGTKIVVIAAGVPQKPNIARVDLFNTNAPIVRDLAQAIGKDAPEAHILITSDPVNSTVSIVTEVLKKASKFNPAKGVITPSFVKSPLYESEGVTCFPSNECKRPLAPICNLRF